MAELGNRDLSGRVIEAAIRVHRALGPGFLESVYEAALCVELRVQEIAFERQKAIKLLYRDVEVGEHRLDILVEGKLLVELKAVTAIEDIFFCDWSFSNEGGENQRWNHSEFSCHATRGQTYRAGESDLHFPEFLSSRFKNHVRSFQKI